MIPLLLLNPNDRLNENRLNGAVFVLQNTLPICVIVDANDL